MLAELGRTPKIAILRCGGLGDFLVTTPALRALRAAVPNATIVVLTTPYLEPLARRYPAVSDVALVPPYPGLVDGPVDGAAIEAFFARVQEERFDLALQWHGGGASSNPFVRRLGAHLTAGFRAADAPPLDYWLPYDERQHEVLRYLDLLALLGGQAQGTALELPLLASDFEALARLEAALDLGQWQAGRLVGINLGANMATRRWAPEAFAAAVNHLSAEADLPGVVVIAPADQADQAERFIAALDRPTRATNLAGRTSLGALIALISRLRLFLTHDTGPAHMANALGIPSVVVFGSSHPLNWAPLHRTWQRAVADWSAPCRYLDDDGCDADSYSPCLRGVSVEAVVAEARQLLHLEALGRVPARQPTLSLRA